MKGIDMMCMKCDCDYVQQTSTARDTLGFCSAECELASELVMQRGIADASLPKELSPPLASNF